MTGTCLKQQAAGSDQHSDDSDEHSEMDLPY